LGGLAIVLHLLTGWPERLLLIAITVVFGVVVYVLRFQWIERIFGLSGLMMIVFAVSAVLLHPDWNKLAEGLLPRISQSDAKHTLLYSYFSVGIFSALLMEYEVHFYSSGAIEEKWTPNDLGENFAVAALGCILGAVLTIGLLVLGALVFLPRGVFPDTLGTAALVGAFPFGKKALVMALMGMIACIGGAAIETALSGAYNVCQFFDLDWSKNKPPKAVPIYTVAWAGMFFLASVIAVTGVRPLQLVNISIIFGMVILPLTYYPILRVAADKTVMGKHVNSRMDNVFGIGFLVLISAAAVAAIPLTFLTHFGKP